MKEIIFCISAFSLFGCKETVKAINKEVADEFSKPIVEVLQEQQRRNDSIIKANEEPKNRIFIKESETGKVIEDK